MYTFLIEIIANIKTCKGSCPIVFGILSTQLKPELGNKIIVVRTLQVWGKCTRIYLGTREITMKESKKNIY